jgi:ribosomal protein S18 acetylase RimI-like enzyme
MQAAIAHASGRSGVTVIQLEVTHGNEPATALYEGLGFQAYGVEPMAVLTPSGYRSKVHMWHQLGIE